MPGHFFKNLNFKRLLRVACRLKVMMQALALFLSILKSAFENVSFMGHHHNKKKQIPKQETFRKCIKTMAMKL